MIHIHNDNYPPLIIFEVHSFMEEDYIKFVSVFNNLLSETITDQIYINVYIDIYNIDEYSIYNIKDITYYFTSLTSSSLKYINKINVYIKKCNTFLLSLLNNIDNFSIMPVNIIELDEKKIW